MSRRRYTAEQIIGMLRRWRWDFPRDGASKEICQGFGITEQIYHRRRKGYGGGLHFGDLGIHWPQDHGNVQPLRKEW